MITKQNDNMEGNIYMINIDKIKEEHNRTNVEESDNYLYSVNGVIQQKHQVNLEDDVQQITDDGKPNKSEQCKSELSDENRENKIIKEEGINQDEQDEKKKRKK